MTLSITGYAVIYVGFHDYTELNSKQDQVERVMIQVQSDIS